MITLYGFSFLGIKFSDVIGIFFINGLERRFSDFLNTLGSVLSDRSKGKKLSFKCSADLQNFRICFVKFKASLSLHFGFRADVIVFNAF